MPPLARTVGTLRTQETPSGLLPNYPVIQKRADLVDNFEKTTW